jgi:hypothetical protein
MCRREAALLPARSPYARQPWSSPNAGGSRFGGRSCSRSAVKEYCQLSAVQVARQPHTASSSGGVTAFRRFFDDKDQLGCRAQRLPCPAVSRPS